jgi:hypothetical protein
LAGSGSKLAAYVNNMLVGTATQSGVAPYVWYAINLQNRAAGPITFKFFHDTGQYIYEIPTTTNFVGGGTLGSIASPYLLQCSPLLPVLVTGNTLQTTVKNTAWVGSFPMNIMVYDCDYSVERRDTVRVLYNVVPNNKPLFVTDSTINFQENSCSAVYDALAVDLSDAEGNGLIYSIQGGADASKFSVNPATGVVSWLGFLPDYEQPLDANVDNHYEVVIRATNQLNLYTDMTVSVEISDQTGEPDTTLILGDRSFCTSGSVLLSVQGGTMYQWNTGSTAVSIMVSTVGVYFVTVTMASGCVIASATIMQNASPIPSIAIVEDSGSANNDGSLCIGSNATLTVSGGVAFAWSTGETMAALSVAPTTTTAYTVTVTDPNSCTATTSTSISVSNFPTPAIGISENSGIANNDGSLCYGDSALLTASGGSTYVWNMAVSTAAISVVPITTTSYTVTVSNSSGCMSTATSTITLEGPVASCVTGPIYVSIDSITGVAAVPVSLVNNGSTDYCATPTITVTPASLGCSYLATNNTANNNVTLSVSDYSPNTSTCTTNVIVSDNTAPVLVCPVNLTVNPVAVCTATVPSLTFSSSATSSPVALEYFDNAATCGLGFSYKINSGGYVNYSNSITNQAVNLTTIAFGLGVNILTVRATDGSANSGTCSVQITVTSLETQVPVANCVSSSINIPLDAQGYANISVDSVNNGSTDNCEIASMIVSPTYLECAAIATNGTPSNNVTLTVTDAAGNVSSCVAMVTVLDHIAPTFTCPANITLTSCNDAVPDVLTGITDAADNCGVPVMTQTPAAGAAFNGQTMITVTATDASGNTTTCNVTVTITDNMDPVIVCPSNIIIGTDVDKCNAVVTYSIPTATDDCSGVVVTLSSGLASGSIFGPGISTEEYTVTDTAGNTVTCSFTVTVVDMQTPTAVCISTTVNLSNATNAGSVTVTAAQVNGGSTDNCTPAANLVLAPANTTYGCANVGDNLITLTVTDTSGNTSTCVATVTVKDISAPVVTQGTIAACYPDAASAAAAALAATSAIDNCLGTLTETASTSGTCSATVSVTTTDANSNVTVVTYNTRIDNTAPTLTTTPYPGTTATNACMANAATAAPFSAANAIQGYTDNCTAAVMATLTNTVVSGIDCAWTVTYTFTVTDGCGNTLPGQTYANTGSDQTPPSLTCPANVNGMPILGTCANIVTGINATYSDNCSTATLTYARTGATISSGSGQASGLSFNSGVTTVTYTATDGCGNSTTCAFTVTVAPCITISGAIVWENNNNILVKDVTVGLRTTSPNFLTLVNSATTAAPGTYSVVAGPSGDYRVTPSKNLLPLWPNNLLNGVTAADATRIQQHITNNPPLVGSYKRIAADVNKSNSITTLDVQLITQAIANNPSALALFNTAWRFVPLTYVFPNSNIPWGFPEKIDLLGISTSQINQNFIGMKLGDVNGTANPLLKPGPPVVWTVNDKVLTAGETIAVTFNANQFIDIAAYQFALGFDPAQLEYASVQSSGVLEFTDDHFGAFNSQSGEFRAIWSTAQGQNLSQGTGVFTMKFNVLESGHKLSEVLYLDETALQAVAYNTALVETGLGLQFIDTQVSGTSNPSVHPDLQLLQNRPNPFMEQTTIGFVLPGVCDAQLRIFDINGKLITEINKQYQSGYQQEIVDLKGQSGVLYYELTTPFGVLAKKMVVTH